MTGKISIFHTIAGIHPTSGGTSRAVVDLADALAIQPSIQPVLISQSLIGAPTVPSNNSKVQRIIAEVGSVNALKSGLKFRSVLQKKVKDNEGLLIHNHGLWLPVNHWASQIGNKHKIPVIIQPHGMLEPWAMQYRRRKKQLALWFFQRQDLKRANIFIATAEQEVESIRRLGLQQPVAVIPNGVATPELPEPVVKKQNIKTALFLSRVHPKKGLISLVRAWAKIRPVNWRVVIAGPDEVGHQLEVEKEIQCHDISDSFTFIGTVAGRDKWELYNSADFFVLPTYSENFGIVVAEALASGLPVITTKGAPWAKLKEHKCGWWIDIGVDPLAQAISEAVNLSSETRFTMGQRGRALVLEKYSWETIAKEMIAVYEWVLKGGTPPDCVVTE